MSVPKIVEIAYARNTSGTLQDNTIVQGIGEKKSQLSINYNMDV